MMVRMVESVLEILNLVPQAAGAVLGGLMIAAAGRERAWRAAGIAVVGLAGNTALWLTLDHWSDVPAVRLINIAALVAVSLFAAVSMTRYFPRNAPVADTPVDRYDERDHMFSRNNMWRHPELAEAYYREHPERQAADAAIQRKPALGAPGGRWYDPAQTPLAEAAFTVLGRALDLAEGEPAPVRTSAPPAAIARMIEAAARLYGAADVGFAALEDLHLYSHAGRHAARWGRPVERRDASAVVLVVTMDWHRIRRAPAAPVMVESSRQYVEAARIAWVVAEYIRQLGWNARAHVDANYEVICPPLAEAAGLGHVGRMGIFMHRVHGPCVRLAVVTTDLELPVTRGDHSSMEHFCAICRKCADNCPAGAIERGSRPVSRGFAHWSVAQEKCYGFWRTAGTDCAVCVAVCPYTKPDTAVHRLVRWYVSRNPLNQRLALIADDALYGRRHRLPSASAN